MFRAMLKFVQTASLESGQTCLPVVEVKSENITVKELKLSRLEWEQRMENDPKNGRQRKVIKSDKFPVNTVSTYATQSDRHIESGRNLPIYHFKPQGNIKDLSYFNYTGIANGGKSTAAPEYRICGDLNLTVVPRILKMRRKQRRLLTETKAQKDSFKKGARQLLNRVSRLKSL